MLMLLLTILLIVGTVALVFWNVLMFVASQEHEMEVAHFTYRTAREKHTVLLEKYNTDINALEKMDGLARAWRKMRHNPKTAVKKMKKLEKTMSKLDSGNFNGINFLVLPGYGFMKMFNITGDIKFFLNTVTMYSNLSGREYAVQNTRYLIAAMISCAIGGIGITSVIGALMFAIEIDMGLWVFLLGPVVSVLLAYALYEDIKTKARKRKDDIMADFAQSVTELALLTSSGMEMFRAWSEICSPPERTGHLYREMRQTIGEINSGFQPAVALEGFIKRCGTKDTSRLGASILQNLTRGNEELSQFLSELSRDVWEERKHGARRLGEQARSKLILPMGLIFLGILVLVGTAVVIGMGGLGF